MSAWKSAMKTACAARHSDCFDHAHKQFEHALQIATAEDNRWRVAKTLCALSELAMFFVPQSSSEAPPARRLRLAREALSVGAAFDNKIEAECLRLIASVAFLVPEEKLDAVKLLRESLSICQVRKDAVGAVECHKTLATSYYLMNQAGLSARSAQEALKEARELGEPRLLAETLTSTAITWDRPDERIAFLDEARRIYTMLGLNERAKRVEEITQGLSSCD